MAIQSSNELDTVVAKVDYLFRDPRHEEEIPYMLGFDANGVIPQTNMQDETHEVVIQNFRSLQGHTSFENYGFTSAFIDRPLAAADFRNDNALRRRDPDFTGTEEISQTVQPATHYTLNSAEKTAHAFFKDEAQKCRRLITVNCWASFQGPGNDWPLAVCDSNSIHYKLDSISADRVFHDRFTEIQRYYYSPKHKWYFLKDMKAGEMLVFRQTDSDIDGGGGVAHTSFCNPDTEHGAAVRESIELRAFVFYS
ncbi:hypothetical protein VTL71DRAFT_11999 [Oculimacula yallundae]|uniref:Methyltransferase n=1 Tax=Oculimacula yallundae TaxID=86028 RepID=A0ABR4CRR1_9HELO